MLMLMARRRTASSEVHRDPARRYRTFWGGNPGERGERFGKGKLQRPPDDYVESEKALSLRYHRKERDDGTAARCSSRHTGPASDSRTARSSRDPQGDLEATGQKRDGTPYVGSGSHAAYSLAVQLVNAAGASSAERDRGDLCYGIVRDRRTTCMPGSDIEGAPRAALAGGGRMRNAHRLHIRPLLTVRRKPRAITLRTPLTGLAPLRAVRRSRRESTFGTRRCSGAGRESLHRAGTSTRSACSGIGALFAQNAETASIRPTTCRRVPVCPAGTGSRPK